MQPRSRGQTIPIPAAVIDICAMRSPPLNNSESSSSCIRIFCGLGCFSAKALVELAQQHLALDLAAELRAWVGCFDERETEPGVARNDVETFLWRRFDVAPRQRALARDRLRQVGDAEKEKSPFSSSAMLKILSARNCSRFTFHVYTRET